MKMSISHRNKQILQKERYGNTVLSVVTIVILFLAGWSFVTGVDQHIKNQDEMLCQSSKLTNNITLEVKYCEKGGER